MDLNALINSGILNLDLLEEKYAQYSQNPSAVDVSWRTLFDQMEVSPVSIEWPAKTPVAPAMAAPLASLPTLPPLETSSRQSVLYYPKVEFGGQKGDWRVFNLIEAYRTYGHLMAKTNPIALEQPHEPPQLDLSSYGFTKQDLSTYFPTCGLLEEESAPLLEIITALKATYCEKIGVEYMGLQNPELEHWLQQHIEPRRFKIDLTMDQKRLILQHLNKSELFEHFIHTKYVGQKRFSLEGAETLIPILAAVVDTGSLHGIDEFIIGMSHRGRLNVLCNIFDKSYADIFSEFEEGYIPASVEGSGDVKYHKGFYSEVKTIHKHKIKLTLTPNPSHLESVGAVVEGQTRARQELRVNDAGQSKVVPILIHGDAAIAGQGIVYETLQLSRLKGYTTGGTIHIIINNQIGFTTWPRDARSTRYCTDIARTFSAPVFHVNAEDPDGCIYVTNLAIELRQKFNCDVFIDLNCYRKFGHNEGDEPAFTQPLEYQLIRKKRPIRELYRDVLIQQGVVEQHLAEALESEFKKALQQAMHAQKIVAKDHGPAEAAAPKHEMMFQHVETGVDLKTLQDIAKGICDVPDGFTIHPKLALLNKERLAMVKEGSDGRPVDWGMAELLAYGTLLWQDRHVRISGQDSCRGTFSHRHALIMDQEKEKGYLPLRHLKPQQGRFDVYNSPLSEYAVLGFEFGYSCSYPGALVVWEAQFGDFSNAAQVVIDQYIATAEQKWNQKFALTLFLPHGYEGQGPEHSSGRIERFLLLAGDNNMFITNPSTPAQFYHLLRRQALRPMCKPLIVFTPKALLRLPACSSSISEFTQGTFQEILNDPTPPKNPKRLVLCSGHIYYSLIAERAKTATDDMLIVRVEQLYPFDADTIKTIISRFPTIKDCIWVQEEPSNMGAWHFIRPILIDLLPKGVELSYVGRSRSASPAVGSYALHNKEHAAILHALFGAQQVSIFNIASQLKA